MPVTTMDNVSWVVCNIALRKMWNKEGLTQLQTLLNRGRCL